jgi:hypothetical protein
MDYFVEDTTMYDALQMAEDDVLLIQKLIRKGYATKDDIKKAKNEVKKMKTYITKNKDRTRFVLAEIEET